MRIEKMEQTTCLKDGDGIHPIIPTPPSPVDPKAPPIPNVLPRLYEIALIIVPSNPLSRGKGSNGNG